MNANSGMLDLARANAGVTASKASLMNLRANAKDNDEALRLAANEFSGLFLGQVYKNMSATIQRSEMFGGGKGEEIFREMLNQEYSRQAAYSDAMGLGKIVYASLKRRQEIGA